MPLIAPAFVYARLAKYEQRAKHRRSQFTGPVTQKEAHQERRRETHIAKLHRESKINKFLEAEIQDIGNVSPRTREMIRHYGKSEVGAINREYPLVHHNTDCTSPISKLEDNFPATIYFPRKVIETIPEFRRKGEQVVTVYNKEQLKLVIQLLVDNDHYIFLNPMWEGLADIRSSRFRGSQAALKIKLPEVKRRLEKLQSVYDDKQLKTAARRRVRKTAVWEKPGQCTRAVKKPGKVESLIQRFERGWLQPAGTDSSATNSHEREISFPSP